MPTRLTTGGGQKPSVPNYDPSDSLWNNLMMSHIFEGVTGSTIPDVTGNGYDLTINAGTIIDVGGIRGHCFDPGTNGASFDPPAEFDSLTSYTQVWLFRVNTDTNESGSNECIGRMAGSTVQDSFFIQWAGNENTIFTAEDADTTSNTIQIGDAIFNNAGEWVTLAIVVDGVNEHQYFYCIVDGEVTQVASDLASGLNGNSYDNDTYWIGHGSVAPSSFDFEASYFFDAAKTLSQIESIHTAPYTWHAEALAYSISGSTTITTAVNGAFTYTAPAYSISGNTTITTAVNGAFTYTAPAYSISGSTTITTAVNGAFTYTAPAYSISGSTTITTAVNGSFTYTGLAYSISGSTTITTAVNGAFTYTAPTYAISGTTQIDFAINGAFTYTGTQTYTLSGGTTEIEDLTLTYALTGGAITAAEAWTIDTAPIMELFLPIEGGLTAASVDYSGNNTPLTLGSGVTWNATGGHDGYGCFDFDGSATAEIDCGAIMPVGSYTISAWIKRLSTATTNRNNILSGNSGHAFWAPDIYGFLLSAGNTAYNQVQDSVALTPDVYVHVAVTYDSVTQTMTLFKGGSQVDQATGIGPATDTQVWVGAFNSTFNIEGSLDDVRVYNIPLSPEQIAMLSADQTHLIDHTMTTAAEDWQSQVTTFSAVAVVDSGSSNIVTIGPAPSILVENVLLTGTTNNHNELDDLTVDYTMSGGAITSATAWDVDGVPLMTLYLPIEGGLSAASLDYSGNDQSLVVGTGVSWNAVGGHDGFGGFDFDGTLDAEIDAGVIMPTGAYTKMAWFRHNNSGQGNILSGNSGHAFWAPASNGFLLSAGHNGTFEQVQDTVPLVSGTDYHVAVTYDPAVAGGTLTLYKNGAPVASTTGIAAITADTQLWVGAYNGQANLNGSIAEVMLYPNALTAQQIASLHTTGPDVIVSQETAINEIWQALITPFSAVAPGAETPSNTLQVNDSTLLYPSRIMPLGDSIAEGVGSTDGGGYRTYLWTAIEPDSNLGLNFVGSLLDGPVTIDQDHEGHAGFSADQIRDAVIGYLDANPTDIILMHLGTNDITAGQTAGQIVAEIGQVLDNIDTWESTNNPVHVYVAQIINRSNPLSAEGLETSALNAEIAAMVTTRNGAGDSLTLVDQESALNYPADLSDTVHPNDAGYAKMAARWLEAIYQYQQAGATQIDLVINGGFTYTAPQFTISGSTQIDFSINGGFTYSGPVYALSGTTTIAFSTLGGFNYTGPSYALSGTTQINFVVNGTFTYTGASLNYAISGTTQINFGVNGTFTYTGASPNYAISGSTQINFGVNGTFTYTGASPNYAISGSTQINFGVNGTFTYNDYRYAIAGTTTMNLMVNGGFNYAGISRLAAYQFELSKRQLVFTKQ